MRKFLSAIALIMGMIMLMASGASAQSDKANENANKDKGEKPTQVDDDKGKPEKVFVCKYVGKPGVDERLKSGKNPISVSENSTDYGEVGSEFADAQGRSLVVAIDNGQEPPTCPAPTECDKKNPEAPCYVPPTTVPPTTTPPTTTPPVTTPPVTTPPVTTPPVDIPPVTTPPVDTPPTVNTPDTPDKPTTVTETPVKRATPTPITGELARTGNGETAALIIFGLLLLGGGFYLVRRGGI